MPPSFPYRRPLKVALQATWIAALCLLPGCGGSASKPPPVVLTVSLGNTTIDLPQGGTASVPVVIVAPTETATFTITGLPAGVTQTYKESESNPSGLLTFTASPTAAIGTAVPTILVGSSGQTASLTFKLVVTAPAMAGIARPPRQLTSFATYTTTGSVVSAGSTINTVRTSPPTSGKAAEL